jgi:hypothetical protein
VTRKILKIDHKTQHDSTQQSSPQESTCQPLVAGLMKLFCGYDKARGEHRLDSQPDQNGKLNGRARTVLQGPASEHYADHLAGKGTSLGIIPLTADSTCWFGAVDIDIKGKVVLRETIAQLEDRVRKLELPLVVCRSKSGGAHLYVFCTAPVPAELVQAKLNEMAATLGYRGCEVFPKQTERQQGVVGNWINIAYYGALSKNGTERYCIRNGKPIRSLREFLDYAELMRITRDSFDGFSRKEALEKSSSIILDGGRNIATFKFAIDLRQRGAEYEEILEKALAYNETNCVPPMNQKEVCEIARNASKYEAGPKESEDSLLVYGRDHLSKRLDIIDSILLQMPDEQLYFRQHSRRLVHVVDGGSTRSDEGVERDPNTLILLDASAVFLRDVVSRSRKVYQGRGDGKLTFADPKKADLEAFLERLRQSPNKTRQRRLRTLSATPILLPDGNILREHGYHELSGSLIIDRGINFEDHNPEEVLTSEECRTLIRENLSSPFCRFPFLKDGDKPDQSWDETAAFSVVISGALCIALRNLLPNTPVHCFSAPAQASGKTLLVQAISALAAGTLPTAVPYKGPEEFAKHLPVLLMKGDRVILVDNIAMVVNNADLAIALTHKGFISSRILGKSEAVEIENNAVFFFTGNNLQLSGEMPSRCLRATIMPDCDDPQHRIFHFNPVDSAMDLHPRAIMALLRVARAHQRAEFECWSSVKELPMRGFNEYDKRVRALLRWIGMSDPITTQRLIAEDDPGRANHEEILWMLAETFGPDSFKVCDLQKLSPESLDSLMQITGHKIGELFNQYKVAHFFARNLKDRFVGINRLVKTGRTPNGKTEWRIDSKGKYPLRKKEDPM